MNIADILKNTSDDELKEMFFEVVEYNRVATLPEDAKVRQLRNKVAESYNDNHFDIGCMLTCSEVTYEVALRHYRLIR